jgi:CHASE3 domain sensor protein
VVTVIDPAALHGAQLYAAMLNQETGLRGYLLSGQRLAASSTSAARRRLDPGVAAR